MYHRHFRKPSKRSVFAMLMVGSVLLLLLPRDILSPTRKMTQLIALPQWAAHQAAIKATESISGLARQQMTAEEQSRMVRDKQGLENENATLRQEIESLKQTVEELALLRQNQTDQQSSLIPATVVGGDAAPGRESLTLAQGRLKGVKHRDWVVSRMFLQAGDEDGVQKDAAVLARQCLLGWIEETAPFTSRVVLLSDPYANRAMRAHIAHYAPGEEDPDTLRPRYLTVGDRLAEFVLRGAGNGRMVVNDIHHDFVDAGLIQVGDLVLSDARDPRLGQSLVIGEIIEVQHNKDKPLLYDVIVAHRFDPKALSQVLIVDRSRNPEAHTAHQQ